MTIEALEKSRCTGCCACADACKDACIQMSADGEGFLRPAIGARCTLCGACARVCPALGGGAARANGVKAYAAWSLNAETRYNSTSGGIFTELAKAVILMGGVVAGARYGGNHEIYHDIIRREEDIPLLRQSKYAQSDARGVYKSVKAALEAGKSALFAGTPCQCAAMRRFAGHERLLLCDFICRGVNSPYVFRKYLDGLEALYASGVRRVWFKNKERGWHSFGTRVDFDNGESYFGPRESDPFMYGYIRKGLNLYMRPSCARCGFKGVSRPVDITLGDFWGLKLSESEDNQRGGVSAVMLHSAAGRELFESIAPYVYREERAAGEILPANACLVSPAPRDEARSARFFKLLETVPFHEAVKLIN